MTNQTDTPTLRPPAPCGVCRRCAVHDDPGGCLVVEKWARDAKYDYVIRDVRDNGEFLSWATVDYLVNGEVTETETFTGSTEEPPGYTGLDLARSAAEAWLDAQTYTLEERLGPYGLEWQRERTADFADVPF